MGYFYKLRTHFTRPNLFKRNNGLLINNSVDLLSVSSLSFYVFAFNTAVYKCKKALFTTFVLLFKTSYL
ncbi:hypothetical protein D3A96_01620 [Robertkochia marina]|nr:hypothetical protein D3A96_01620 [Robertkochia marina]